MKALTIVLAVACFALAAHATAIDSAVGHGLKITDPAGGETTYRLAADQTFASERTSGEWKFENDRLCLTPTGGATFCLPYAEEKQVGDSWTISGPTGRVQFNAELVD